MLFKVEVRYSSLVGQILVLNCRHQGLVLLLKFTFKREDLSVNSEDQYFPIEGSIAIHVYNLKIVLTIAGHLMLWNFPRTHFITFLVTQIIFLIVFK